jgi:hypothetical protein
MPNPVNSGPNQDGSQSLAKESKAGLAVAFVLQIAAVGALDALNKIDLSGATGWWTAIAGAGVSTGIGLITAWLKKNR